MFRENWGVPMLSVLLKNQFFLSRWQHQGESVGRYTHQYTRCTRWIGRIAYKIIGIWCILEEQSETMQTIFSIHRKDKIHRTHVLAETGHRFVGRLSKTWVTVRQWDSVTVIVCDSFQIDQFPFYCHWIIEILENHRISRSVIENKTDDQKNATDGETKTNKLKIAQNRDLNDVLGPLPAIPSSSVDNSSRWSIRRVSGYSGIYEEILDPAASE